MSKTIIGLAGQAASGKDTVANILIPHLNQISGFTFVRNSFAGNVKKIFAQAFGVDLDFIEEWKRKDVAPQNFLVPVRRGLQMIGDGFRQIKSDVWIEFVLKNPQNDLVISDVRYCNEALQIKKYQGINVCLIRPDMMNNDTNDSEKIMGQIALHFDRMGYDGSIVYDENYPMFDYFLKNDGDLKKLEDRVVNELLPYIKSKIGVLS
jgi:hypothetical protein